MSASEISQILAAIDELKQEVVALKAWQTQRDNDEHDSQVRHDAYWRVARWAFALWKSDVAKFLIAGLLAYAGLRTA